MFVVDWTPLTLLAVAAGAVLAALLAVAVVVIIDTYRSTRRPR